MLSEEQHIGRIQASLTKDGFATNVSLHAIEQALQEYPNSTKLWCLRGDLIQLDNDCANDYQLVDALASYQKALEIDPNCIEAYEEVGHFFEVILDEPEKAGAYFERAEVLRRQNGV